MYFFQARLFFHHPKYGVLDECTKYASNDIVQIWIIFFELNMKYFISFFCDSATSVDVEEHLYKLANEMGITVITSSQVTNERKAFNCVYKFGLSIHCLNVNMHFTATCPPTISFNGTETYWRGGRMGVMWNKPVRIWICWNL